MLLHGARSRSLYRRCLRAAELCVDEHRPWMTSYVRLRFRDDVGSREKLPARLSEGEEELARMLVTLERAGRLVPRAGGVESASSQPPHSATPSASCPLDTATGWSEARVQRWLSECLGMGEHVAAFARHRVDGALLLQLDDTDIGGELGVASRLQRKRLLVEIERLRHQGPGGPS